MHILASILLLINMVIHLLLGGTYLLSSQYQEQAAREDVEDLSLVAQDLATEENLAQERHQAQSKIGFVGLRETIFGILTLVIGVFEAAAAILVFLRKARKLVLSGLIVVIAALAAQMVLNGKVVVLFISIGLLATAFLFILRQKPVPQPAS